MNPTAHRNRPERRGPALARHGLRPRLLLESLEERLVPATITWDGGAASLNWSDAQNWDTNSLPTAADDVVINLPASSIVSASGSFTIRSINSTAGLSISGGSFSVTQGTSVIGSTLSIASDSTLSASGSTSFTATGAASIDGASILADAGASIALPGATTYTAARSGSLIRATQDGRIDLHNVANLFLGNFYGSSVSVQAKLGGSVDLASLAYAGDGGLGSQGAGAIAFAADGPNSLISLPALLTLNDTATDALSSISISAGGAVSAGRLRDLVGTFVSADAAPAWFQTLATVNSGVIALSGVTASFPAITTFARSTLSASAGSASLPAATNIDGSSFVAADAATVSATAATSYVAASSNALIRASGPGSRVDLRNVANFFLGNFYGSSVSVQAKLGGSVDLASLAYAGDGGLGSQGAGAIAFAADGPSSLLALPSFTTFKDTALDVYSSISLSNGATMTLGTSPLATSGVAIALGSGAKINGSIDLGSSSYLDGSGTVTGDLTNRSTVRVGGTGASGILNVLGNYTQTALASIAFEVGGRTVGEEYDRLVVGGTASFNGNINAGLIGGFVPVLGDTFQILSFRSASGGFSSFTGFQLSGGLAFAADQTNSALNLVVVDSLFDVTPTSGLVTNEAGKTATFTVRLRSRPTDNVAIDLTSSRPTEGLPSPTRLVFTPQNWNVPQTVTIAGVDDNTADGDQIYKILLAPIVGTLDTAYLGQDPPDITVLNIAKDIAGVTVSPSSGLTTSEAGGTASFSVVLEKRPTSNVTISLTGTRPGEGAIGTTSLTFTPANWMVPQTITVTGVDDSVADGNQSYQILVGAAVSSDPLYAGLKGSDVTLTNLDNDSVGILVSPTTGLMTSESGIAASFALVLKSQPTANVLVPILSTAITEGVVSTSMLTFTPANWNVPQVVTVTGVDDQIIDGNVSYTIETGSSLSADPGYSNLDPADVAAINVDNDTPGVTVSPSSGLTTSEAGGTATFTVVLNAKPQATVTFNLSSSTLLEGRISASQLSFSPTNWNLPQTVTVTGVNDSVDDGDIAYTIFLSPTSSADPLFNGLVTNGVAVVNLDDDVAGISATPTSGLITTEIGGAAAFQVVLTSQPTTTIFVNLTSTRTGEGLPSPAVLMFTPTTWNTPQTVQVFGQPDSVADGDQAYQITSVGSGQDPKYAGLKGPSVNLTNLDSGASQPTLKITKIEVVSNGIIVRFNRPIAPADLNLYDTATANLGPADVTIVGAATGPVAGSLIVAPDNLSVTFVRTAGPLPVDSYALTLRSASNGFHDAAGELFDGDFNNSPGGSLSTTFGVAATSARYVSIPSFARGPGQAVVVPAAGTGLPIRVSNGNGVVSADLRIRYNPSLLNISGVTLGASAPADAAVTFNANTPGLLIISYTASTPLPSNPVDFLTLNASVPANAPYGSKEVVDIESVSLNEAQIPTWDVDAVHAVAYFGDTTGNGGYSGLDATRAQRVITQLDGGFDAYQLLDPVIIADVTGNGSLSSLDATRIRQQVALLSPVEIPPLPSGVTPSFTGGPDPILSLGRDLKASPSGTLKVPVRLQQVDRVAVGLSSFDFYIRFDPGSISVGAITLGDMAPGFGFSSSVDAARGLIAVSASRAEPLTLAPGADGTVAWIEVTVKAAASGTIPLNLLAGLPDARSGLVVTSLNEGGLTLSPAPTNRDDDPVDGRIVVTPAAPKVPPRVAKLAGPSYPAAVPAPATSPVAPGVVKILAGRAPKPTSAVAARPRTTVRIPTNPASHPSRPVPRRPGMPSGPSLLHKKRTALAAHS